MPVRRYPRRGPAHTGRRAAAHRRRAVRSHRAWARPRLRSRSPTVCAPTGRIRWRCPPTRSRSIAGSRPSPARPRAAEQEQLEHRLLSFVPVDAPFSAGAVRAPRARRDRRAARGRPPADRRRRHRPVPARRARRPRPAPARPGRVRERRRTDLRGARRARAARRAGRARRRGGRPSAHRHRSALVRALELLDAGHAPPAGGSSCGPPRPGTHAARRPDDGARGAEGPDRRARARDGRGRRGRRGPRGGGRRRLDHGPQGARVPGAAGRRRRGDAAQHPPLRAPPAHVDAQAARTCCCSTPPAARRTRSRPSCTPRYALARHDPPRALREVAGPRQRLPDPRAGGAARSAHARTVQRLCDPTSASAPTACSSCPRPTSPASSPACASSTRTARRPSCPATAHARRSSTCAAPAGPTPTRSRSRPRPGRSGPPSPARPPAGSTWAAPR